MRSSRVVPIASAVILLIYLLIRLIDYSGVVSAHPLSTEKHDLYSYVPQLFFLKACGFHANCPYWYNGIRTFVGSPPGWYFLFYPLYLITDNVLLTFYLSLVLLFTVGFLFFLFISRRALLSWREAIFLFGWVFGNHVAINSLRLGRMPELWALLFFLIGGVLLLSYRKRPLDGFFWALIPIYAMTILTYHAVGILLSFLFAGLLLSKQGRERVQVLISIVISFALSSFWWLPLVLDLRNNLISQTSMGVEAWWMFSEFSHFTTIAVVVLPLIFFSLFFLYCKSHRLSRLDTLFFFPSALLIVLFFFGALPFLPIFRNIFTNLYFLFIIFLCVILFLEVKDTSHFVFARRIAPWALVFFAMITVGISLFNTPFFDPPTIEQMAILNAVGHAERNFLILGDLRPYRTHPVAYYSYASIFFNLTTPGGVYPVLTRQTHLDALMNAQTLFSQERCGELTGALRELSVVSVVSVDRGCKFLQLCANFSQRFVQEPACLYTMSFS